MVVVAMADLIGEYARGAGDVEDARVGEERMSARNIAADVAMATNACVAACC